MSRKVRCLTGIYRDMLRPKFQIHLPGDTVSPPSDLMCYNPALVHPPSAFPETI